MVVVKSWTRLAYSNASHILSRQHVTLNHFKNGVQIAHPALGDHCSQFAESWPYPC
jgi:hypothetical protein